MIKRGCCVLAVLCAITSAGLCLDEYVYANDWDYDYSDIDDAIDSIDEADIEQSFGKLVESIVSEGDYDGNIVGRIGDILFGVLRNNRSAIVQIILLTVLSGAVGTLIPDISGGQVSLYAHMIIEVSMITILSAAFYSACKECQGTIDNCITIYKAVIPVFFSAVAVTTGNVTTAAYYEVILMVITVINSFCKNVFVGLIKAYMLLNIADAVMGKEQFSKMSELVYGTVKTGCKIMIALFTGIGGIKGLIAPTTDALKKNVVMKGLKLMPVVGSSVDAVSGTVVGAAVVIKNAIGTAAIVVLITVCSFPVLKLVLISVLYKFVAAITEPVADKRLIKLINALSTAVGMLALIDVVVMSLFILMTAIVCVSTNLL